MTQDQERQFSLTRAFVTSLISAFLFVVSVFFSMFAFGFLRGVMGSGSFVFYVAAIMLVLTLCGAALFGPAYYETRKFGWFEGMITLVFSAVIALGFIILISGVLGGGEELKHVVKTF